MKKIFAILTVALLAVTAVAQFIPALNAPSITDNETYVAIRAQGVSQGIPVSATAQARVTITNFVLKVGPQTDISFFMKLTATTNANAKLLIDTSADNLNWSFNQPLSVTLAMQTNGLTQPTTTWGRLLATNFTSVRYIRVTYLTNEGASAFVPSNIVAGFFQRSP